ncbi:hypothetical protein [Streptomyces sp. XD-27]|uniref:hypothetical protein n=1 Tax=Streptomyces sp. XD-27 TaxID=3062779 RepID=UPI0026F46C18|nr:hypothetical protein [Streptomyces sp. XD-27]WKX70212.1 hypothetical protein Q3Y56_10035 [Streptomyces sp. XD-27]
MASLLMAFAAVTLTVWGVSLIRPVRWRALVYSLPLPITLVLATTPVDVDGSQVLGVVALNLFFAVTAWLHARRGWHIVLADLAGVLAYLALSRLVAVLAPVPFVPVLAAVCAAWVAAAVLLPPPAPGRPAEPAARPGALVKLAGAASGGLLMVAIGRYLSGLVVTFPYAGVLVVIEARRDLVQFARHFTRNSISLVAFFGACHALQSHGKPVALTAGWLAFTACALGLHLRLWR